MSVLGDFYDAADLVYGSGEHADWPEVEAPYLELADMLWQTERQIAVWRQVRDELKAQMLAQMGDRSFHDGTWLYRPSRRRRRFVQDPEQLLRFLDDPHYAAQVLKLDGPDPIRVTALRAFAEWKGLDVEAVEDTLLVSEWGEPSLEKVRLDDRRCPAFVKERRAGELI